MKSAAFPLVFTVGWSLSLSFFLHLLYVSLLSTSLNTLRWSFSVFPPLSFSLFPIPKSAHHPPPPSVVLSPFIYRIISFALFNNSPSLISSSPSNSLPFSPFCLPPHTNTITPIMPHYVLKCRWPKVWVQRRENVSVLQERRKTPPRQRERCRDCKKTKSC